MSSVYRLRGLPGSGKSTYAKMMLDIGGADIRINRDTIRAEVCGYEAPNNPRNAAKEPLVTRICDAMIITAIREEKSVVLDNVHGTSSARDFVRFKAAGYILWDIWFQTPVDSCILACQNRDRKVPEEVIRKFILKYPHLDPKNHQWGKSGEGILTRKVFGHITVPVVEESNV